MRKQNMDPKVKEAIIDAMNKTWNYIAYDATECSGGRISKAGIIDIVIDQLDKGTDDKEMLKQIRAIDYKELVKIGRGVFTTGCSL